MRITTYRKPEVAALGEAAQIIHGVQMLKTGHFLEYGTGNYWAQSPAYDLDE